MALDHQTAAWSLADSQMLLCLTMQVFHIHTGFLGLALWPKCQVLMLDTPEAGVAGL